MPLLSLPHTTKSFCSTLVACVCPIPHVGKRRGLPPLPFMEFHPPHPYCIPGDLHYLLPLPLPRTCRACLLHWFLIHCLVYGAPYNPYSTLSSQGVFPPSDFLEGNGRKWHILATGAVSALHGICVRITLFKGSLISKMRVEGTFHFQGSCMSFKSWNP